MEAGGRCADRGDIPAEVTAWIGAASGAPVEMGVHKQTVSFTDTAFDFARELVESGKYPNISATLP